MAPETPARLDRLINAVVTTPPGKAVPHLRRGGSTMAIDKGPTMPVSELSAIERIARVLAGRHWSSNADGSEPHAGHEVMSHWYDYREDAIAILRTLREPDMVMAEAGDAEIWRTMVEAAIQEYFGDAGAASISARSAGDRRGADMLQPPKLGDVTD